MLQFAHHAARERESLTRYPDPVELFVATLRDPVNQRVGRDEYRVFISPFALLTRFGIRKRAVLEPAELARVSVPTW